MSSFKPLIAYTNLGVIAYIYNFTFTSTYKSSPHISMIFLFFTAILTCLVPGMIAIVAVFLFVSSCNELRPWTMFQHHYDPAICLTSNQSSSPVLQ